ncbi:MAG: hypothetical protein NWE93_08175 [Candidatus Bathyarchaeota archaeon]|nr:hypothetical protein [Candidatus Bathyarchaeota archaeon]
MKASEMLANRIRGWFPQEPRLICSANLQGHEAKQPPRIIPSDYTLSTTKYAVVLAVFNVVLFGFMSFSIGLELRASLVTAAWVTMGAAAGLVCSWALTTRQLGVLAKEYHYRFTAKELVLLLLIAAMPITGGFACWSIYGRDLSPFLALLYPWVVSFAITRPLLLAAFERKNDMRIVQSTWGTGMYLIPKPPQDNISSRAGWRR